MGMSFVCDNNMFVRLVCERKERDTHARTHAHVWNRKLEVWNGNCVPLLIFYISCLVVLVIVRSFLLLSTVPCPWLISNCMGLYCVCVCVWSEKVSVCGWKRETRTHTHTFCTTAHHNSIIFNNYTVFVLFRFITPTVHITPSSVPVKIMLISHN